MAAVISQFNDNFGLLDTTITGITNASTTPSFTMRGYVFSGATLFGTFGANCSVQLQGGNDNATWENIGAPLSQAGGFTLTPSQVFYRFYQFVITGGDGTTNLTIQISGVIPR